MLKDRAFTHLPRARAHGIQKPPVVGDNSKRTAPRCQVAGKPVNSFQVKVVGGLIQQQQLRIIDEQPGQRDAPPLATAQRPNHRVRSLRKPGHRHTAEQPVKDGSNARAPCPFVLGSVANHRSSNSARSIELITLRDHVPGGVIAPHDGA